MFALQQHQGRLSPAAGGIAERAVVGKGCIVVAWVPVPQGTRRHNCDWNMDNLPPVGRAAGVAGSVASELQAALAGEVDLVWLLPDCMMPC